MRAANAALLRNLRALWARPPFFSAWQHRRHKSQSRNVLAHPERGGWRAQRAGRGQPKAAYIIYCPAGQSTTLSVQRTLLNLRTLRIFLNHNPSTQPAAEGGCNLRARRARPPLVAAPPQPSARRAVKPKNLRPQSGRRTVEPFAPFGRKTL